MAATKDQERKALEKIRKIVGELGDDSYIGMAFEGCIEDAEENIENDWGCSWKQRAEVTGNKLIAARKRIDDLVADIAQLRVNAEKAQKEIDRANRKTLTSAAMNGCLLLVVDAINEVSEKKSEAADEIVKFADRPDSAEFKNAVLAHRGFEEDLEYYKGLAREIRDAQNA